MPAATAIEVVSVFPELASVGPVSAGVLTFTGVGTTGDTIKFEDRAGAQLLLLTAGTDFVIGGTATATATAVETAISASALFTATRDGAIVYVSTVATGYASAYTSTATGSDWTWGAALLVGGSALLDMAVGLAAASLPAGTWGARYYWATLLYAAHVVAFTGRASTGGSGAAGSVASQMTIDKLSATFATAPPAAGAGAFASTTYGQQYLAMRSASMRGQLGIVGRGTMQRLGS